MGFGMVIQEGTGNGILLKNERESGARRWAPGGNVGSRTPPPSPSRFPYLLVSPSQIPFFSPISTLKRQVFVQNEMNVRFRLAPAIDILNLSYCFKKKIKLFVPQYDERARYDNCMGRPVRLWAVLERKYRNGLDLVFVGGTVLIVAGV